MVQMEQAVTIAANDLDLPTNAATNFLRVAAEEIIRIVLASILLFSGLVKLRDPFQFLNDVYGYELTGPLLSVVVATVLPWLEITTSICLWGKVCYRGALAVSVALTTLFTLVIALALYRQLDISCGCFMAQDKIGYVTLLRSLALLAAAILGFSLSRNSTSL